MVGPSLADLERIFSDQLQAHHIPLLGSYLTMLRNLAEGAPDPEPYEIEMKRVQGWIEAGGVVNLKMARKALGSEDKMAVPEPETTAERLQRLGPASRSWIVLTPDLAREIEPEPAASDLSAGVGVVANLMTWRIEHLPEGTYEVVMRYSSATDADFDTPVRVSFAGQRIDDDVPPVKRGKPEATMRLAGLGRLHLLAPVEAEVLTLQVLGGEDARIRLKEVIIAPQNPLPRSPSGN